MTKRLRLLGMTAALLAMPAVTQAQGNTFVIRNATIVPVTGPRIPNGSVVIQDGKITAVGASVNAPAGATVIDATGQFVYPGFIDSGTQMGLTEIGGVPGPMDVRELGDFNPHLITTTAVNVGSEHIGVTRANGITTVLTAPGGSVMSGLAGLVNLAGYTNEEMIAKEQAALLLTWPNMGGGGGRGGFGGFGGRGGGRGANPEAARAEYDRQVRQIYRWFADARAYNEVKARLTTNGAQPPVSWKTDYRLEAMGPALRGEMPVLIDANTVEQMRDALKFMDSVRVRIVIRGAREGWQFADTLAARRVPVVVGPLTGTPGPDEPYDLVFASPGVMQRAGVMLAFQSGATSSARDLPYELGLGIAFGLDPEEALKTVTINPARIWGVESEYGSIEPGKWANLMVTTGDPIDIRTTIKEVFVKGARQRFDDRHTELYERYRARPKPAKPPR